MSRIQVVNQISPYNKVDAALQVINDYKDEIAYSFGDILELDQEYTFSCWFKADKNIQITINISDQQKKFDVTTEWKRLAYTAPSNTTKSKVVFFSIPPYSTLNAFEGQLEIGNKASDFKLSMEDVEHSINSLQTDFKVEQGRIDALIKDTTIDNADGSTTKIKYKYLEMNATVDGMKTTIGNVQTDVQGMNAKITEIKTTADGVKTTVTANQSKWDNANVDVGSVNMIRNSKTMTYLDYGIVGAPKQFAVLTDPSGNTLTDQNGDNLIVNYQSLEGRIYITDLQTANGMSDTGMILTNQNNVPLWTTLKSVKDSIVVSPELKAELDKKLNKNQGVVNKGKLLSVADDGNISYVEKTPPFILSMATEQNYGGIKAKAKTTETVEVSIDTTSGKLYVPAYPTFNVEYATDQDILNLFKGW